jgi:Tfp pilus assembly protein PilN
LEKVKYKTKNILAVVITPDKIGAAELTRSSGGIRLIRYSQFSRSVSGGLTDLQSEIDDFRGFLKQNSFKFKTAAVAVSSRNILTTMVDVSNYADADKDVFASAVQLDLEHRFEFDTKEAVFDCEAFNGNNRPKEILAAAVLNRDVHAVCGFFDRIGIKVISLSVSLLAPPLHRDTGICVNMILYSSHTGFVVFNDSRLQVLKCLPSGPHRLGRDAPAVAELKRLLLVLENTKDISCRIWGVESPGGEIIESFRKVIPDTRFERISRPSQLEWITVSLGERMLNGGCELDFLNTHLAGTVKSRPRLWRGRIAAAVFILLAFAFAFFGGWYMDIRDAAAAKQQFEDISQRLQKAQTVIQRAAQARPWFSRQTEQLNSLKELTLCFPEYPDIWLTSLAVDEKFNQVISGRAVSENAVLNVVETMNTNSCFSGIKILYIRKANKNSDMVTFAVNFKYERGL